MALPIGIRPLHPSELLGRDPIYLLVIELGGSDSAPGKRLLFATEATTVSDTAGNSYAFRGGLAYPDVSLSDDSMSIGLSIFARPNGASWPEYIAVTEIEGARGLLLQWTAGAPLEHARVIMSGVLTALAYGDPDAIDTLAISLESIPLDTGAPMVDPDHRMTRTNWPVRTPIATYSAWAVGSDENKPRALGLPYPFVYGKPLWTPGLLVERRNNLDGTVLVAVGRVAATSVQVWDRVDRKRGTVALSETFDNDGTLVTKCDPSTGGLICQNTSEYLIGWDLSGGGAVGSDGELLRGGGSLVIHALQQAQIESPYMRIDIGRCEAARPYLDGFLFDGYVQGGDWITWLQSDILRHMPAQLVEGPGGWYPLVWRWDATLADTAGPSLVVGENAVRIGPILRSHGHREIYNRFVLDFAPRDYPRPATERAVQGVNHLWICRESLARYGLKRTWRDTAHTITDSATAVQVCRWRAHRDALPRVVVGVTVSLDIGGSLERGAVVAIADPLSGLGSVAAPRVGVVVGIEYRGHLVAVALAVVPGTVRG